MKGKIRKEINGMRDNTPDSELNERSERIKENLFRASEFVNAKTILFYVSTRSEVRTEQMIKDSLKLGKKVAVPSTDLEKHMLCSFELKDFEKELAPGAFGIPEPKKGVCNEIPIEEIDLITIPGTAFDRKGDRIGYGKGFYDKLLSSMKDVTTIGLAYDFQIVPQIPEEEHDVKVDMIVTENEIIKT